MTFEEWVTKTNGSGLLLNKEDSPKLWGGDSTEWERNPYEHPWTRGALDGWNAAVKAEREREGVEALEDALKSTMALAYGQLWHIVQPNSKRVEDARKLLRDAIGEELCRWGIEQTRPTFEVKTYGPHEVYS